MEKKLPKVFANQPKKEFSNNNRVYCSNDTNEQNNYKGDRENKNFKSTKIIDEQKNIYQKIADIFNSEKYVYKAQVEIKTSKGIKTTNVVGQNRTHLITIDNELIPITDIEDIYYIN